MTFADLAELTGCGLIREVQKQRVAELDGEDVIFAHNRLKELDDMLRDRWYELDCPHPELLK